MSWIEVNDVRRGHTVLELQPTVVEVWRADIQGSLRIHLRLLQITPQGGDGQGHQTVRLDLLSGGAGTEITVDDAGLVEAMAGFNNAEKVKKVKLSLIHI